jgi:hypothetical protein
MAYAKILPEVLRPIIEANLERRTLRDRAVAIDPPPPGAIGIEELLGRFENFPEAQDLTALPENGPVGVRQLLERLDNLARAGHFSADEDDGSEEK